jgi:nucleoside-diphosphate-sugar epimerase
MSFDPSEITAEIKHFYPDFQVDYQPDSRQLISNKWPKSIDDSEARNDWGWKPEYNLRMMTTEMLEKLKEKYNNIKLK